MCSAFGLPLVIGLRDVPQSSTADIALVLSGAGLFFQASADHALQAFSVAGEVVWYYVLVEPGVLRDRAHGVLGCLLAVSEAALVLDGHALFDQADLVLIWVGPYLLQRRSALV